MKTNFYTYVVLSSFLAIISCSPSEDSSAEGNGVDRSNLVTLEGGGPGREVEPDPTRDIKCLSVPIGGAKTYNALGSGTLPDPYRILNADQLRDLAMHLKAYDKHFKQCQDIDLTGKYSLPAFSYFSIGSEVANFTGTYDGDGHSIEGFEYNQDGPFFKDPSVSGLYDDEGNLLRKSVSNVGLFGWLENATVKNLKLVLPKVLVKESYVGALAGLILGSSVSNISILAKSSAVSAPTGVIKGESNVGGTIGYAYASTLLGLKTERVKVWGGSFVGGLVGWFFDSSLDRSFISTGDIRPNADVSWRHTFGGAVGFAYHSTLLRIYSGAKVDIGTPARVIGGLVGSVRDGSTLTYSHATGEVNGDRFVGGLAGEVTNSTVEDSYATGNVFAAGAGGGLVGLKGGQEGSKIERSYATGNVMSTDKGDEAGGFVGVVVGKGTIKDCYATGNVSGLKAGGFVGYYYDDSNTHEIISSYASGTVGGDLLNTGSYLIQASTDMGGFVGYQQGSEKYLQTVTVSNVEFAPAIVSGVHSYGKFVGRQGVASSSVFDSAYFYEFSSCPLVGCNTIGNSVADKSTFTGDALSKAPFHWTFDSKVWTAVPGALPILPHAGAN